MTKANAYDRRQIMRAAWTETRSLMRMFGYSADQMRGIFVGCLKSAWAKAKAAAALLSRSAASLRAELVDMNNRDRLGHAGFARMDELRNALHRIENKAA